jgi:hypothetical protein
MSFDVLISNSYTEAVESSSTLKLEAGCFSYPQFLFIKMH